jgi:hypothetical protein
MPVDVEARISEHPAVMVGTLVSVESGNDPFGQAVFQFQVERWVKGDLGETAHVYSVVGDGGNCGLFPNIGERVGLFLYLEEGHLTSNTCLMADPEVLLTAGGGPQAVPPLTVDNGVGVVPSHGDNARASTDLARGLFLGIFGAGLVASVVVYLRRDRQVNPPSAF